MTVLVTQTGFVAGELDPRLFGRLDLRAYESGAAKLRNVLVDPGGGVSRRSGMAHIAATPGRGRLIAFTSAPGGPALVHLSEFHFDIYRDGALVASEVAPWTEEQLTDVSWALLGDSLLICHPEAMPKRIHRQISGDWTAEPWIYRQIAGVTHQPYARYAAPEVSLETDATTGTVTVITSHPVFKPAHQGTILRKQRKEIFLSNYQSPTQFQGLVLQDLDDVDATYDWDEQAFSEARGYPISVAIHQQRLVIGGGRDLSNRLWFSKVGDPFNFDLGTGLDDEAIGFALTSTQPQRIRALFSGRHLQVFTTGGEWIVTGIPITPATAQVQQQTAIGSISARQVPPRDVDGATLFAAANGRELREFLFTDTEQAYQAADVALLSRHLLVDPVDQDFDQSRRLFWIALFDGSLATLTIDRNSAVVAWTGQQTDGHVLALAVLQSDVYFLVQRDQGVMLERLDDTQFVDSGMRVDAPTPSTFVSGLDHLEGATVAVVADGVPVEDAAVVAGAIVLTTAAREVLVGRRYTHVIEPLPLALASGRGANLGAAHRPVRISFRLLETSALRVDTGMGPREVPLRRVGGGVLDQPGAPFTGDLGLRAYGWRRGIAQPPWRIEQTAPLPQTLLSATTELKVNA